MGLVTAGVLLPGGAGAQNARRTSPNSPRRTGRQKQAPAGPRVAALSAGQAAVVERLRAELHVTVPRARGDGCLRLSAGEAASKVEADLSGLDSVLVGKHVVFSKKWLGYVDGGLMTRQEFAQWRNETDRVYDCYVGLVGQKPNCGEMVFADLVPDDKKKTSYAHAHAVTNVICYFDNPRVRTVLPAHLKHSGCDAAMIHEMSHVFANGMPWLAEYESLANVMMAYVLETAGIRYGAASNPVAGAQHRLREFAEAQEKFEEAQEKKGRNVKMRAFAYEDGTVYDYYLLGLVDKVGWGAYKKAFRSYHDGSYAPKNYGEKARTKAFDYKGADKKVIARDFLDRLEYFSGKSGVLKSLPDKGELLKKHFSPREVKG